MGSFDETESEDENLDEQEKDGRTGSERCVPRSIPDAVTVRPRSPKRCIRTRYASTLLTTRIVFKLYITPGMSETSSAEGGTSRL